MEIIEDAHVSWGHLFMVVVTGVLPPVILVAVLKWSSGPPVYGTYRGVTVPFKKGTRNAIDFEAMIATAEKQGYKINAEDAPYPIRGFMELPRDTPDPHDPYESYAMTLWMYNYSVRMAAALENAPDAKPAPLTELAGAPGMHVRKLIIPGACVATMARLAEALDRTRVVMRVKVKEIGGPDIDPDCPSLSQPWHHKFHCVFGGTETGTMLVRVLRVAAASAYTPDPDDDSKGVITGNTVLEFKPPVPYDILAATLGGSAAPAAV